ncbi:MAG: hypothetical protein WBX27_15240, partial [Specibacter sp.]
MDNEFPTTASTEAAAGTTPAKATRSRRASAKVTSTAPATVPVEVPVDAAPAKKAPVRRSRAKKVETAEPSLLDGLDAASAAAPEAAPAKRAT